MTVATEDFVPLDQRELDRVADAIARKRGAGPLHLMPADSAGRYRAMARAAIDAAADCVAERMEDLPHGGRHTRATWAVVVLRGMSAR